MSAIPTKQIDGDVAVGRNVAAGGNANIQGNARVGHDLVVEGWLEARNVKSANKGLFASAESLRKAYPQPHEGWFAGVSATAQDLSELEVSATAGKGLFRVYVGSGGDWVALAKLYEINVDNVQVENLRDDLSALSGAHTVLKGRVDGHDTDIRNMEAVQATLSRSINTNTDDIADLKAASGGHEKSINANAAAIVENAEAIGAIECSKGQEDGIASLDGEGRIPLSQLPVTAVVALPFDGTVEDVAIYAESPVTSEAIDALNAGNLAVVFDTGCNKFRLRMSGGDAPAIYFSSWIGLVGSGKELPGASEYVNGTIFLNTQNDAYYTRPDSAFALRLLGSVSEFEKEFRRNGALTGGVTVEHKANSVKVCIPKVAEDGSHSTEDAVIGAVGVKAGLMLPKHVAAIEKSTEDIEKLIGEINTLLGEGASSAIDTFNEVEKFLAGVTDSETLTGLLTALKTELQASINGKVDKVTGKGLSTNDYTDADRTKLGALPTNTQLTEKIDEAKLALFVDLWSRCYDCQYDPTKAKPFSCNGVELTYQEARDVYNAPRIVYPYFTGANQLAVSAKTLILSSKYAPGSSANLRYAFYNGAYTVIRIASDVDILWVSNSGRAFGYCQQLEKILGAMRLETKTSNEIFFQCVKLQEVKINHLSLDISFHHSPLLSLASLTYLVTYAANTSPITVTVHPDVYAKLTATEHSAQARSNLALNSDVPVTSANYPMKQYPLNTVVKTGDALTVTVWGTPSEGSYFYAVIENCRVEGNLVEISPGVWQKTFVLKGEKATAPHLNIYNNPNNRLEGHIDKVKICYGLDPSPQWSAPVEMPTDPEALEAIGWERVMLMAAAKQITFTSI